MARQDRALDLDVPQLSESEIGALTAFLHSLTGQSGNTRPLGRPESVPSGLPVD